MHLSSIINIRGLENNKFLFMIFVKIKNGGHISTPIAIVGRAPNGDQSFVKMLLIPLHNQLMRSEDSVNIIFVVEFLDDIFSEEKACASG